MNNVKIDVNLFARLDALLQHEVDIGRMPGCGIQVGNSNGLIYQKAFGVSDLDTIYCLCSMTKPITAIAALGLIDQGYLSPRDLVSDFLPAFADAKVYSEGTTAPLERPLIVRDLLNMTSGLPYPVSHEMGENDPVAVMLHDTMMGIRRQLDEGKVLTCAQICNGFAKCPLSCQPGDMWEYGISADILGAIIEVVTQTPLRDYLKQSVLDPLGMKDTDFMVPKGKINRVTDIFMVGPNGPQVLSGRKAFPYAEEPLTDLPTMTSGGGGLELVKGRGLYSTLEDYSRFARMLLRGGELDGQRFYSVQTSKDLCRNHLTTSQMRTLWPLLMDGYGYGNLMRVMVAPGLANTNGNSGEFGWDGFLGTYFGVDYDADLYFVYMQNGSVNMAVREKVRRLIYSAIQ